MSNFFDTFVQPGLTGGLCYGIAAIGVSLPLRFLGAADFTAIGSVMLGGILTVWLTNISHYAIGLVVGPILAALLGLITALLCLHRRLQIPLMLAGIICFIASQSLGLFITKGGTIELKPDITFLYEPFTWIDTIIVGVIVVLVCSLGGILAKSKWGCFAFGLCANTRFIKFKHRHRNATTALILLLSNYLVALCGGLLALKSHQAYVDIHSEFLSLTLGAIFAGHAGVHVAARVFQTAIPGELEIESAPDTTVPNRGAWESFKLSLSTQRDDSERMWFILTSYVIASILLSCVTQAVRGHAIGPISPIFEHAIVALIITFGLFVSSLRSNSIHGER
ncbi:MAG: hypothetical protein ACO1QS_01015 [Verrucomicrobiota bacterium]